MKNMTLANKITLIRIVLIPVFIITLLQGLFPWPAIIFTVTIISDALDGFVARRRKQITPLGSFLDPLADKLLMFSSYLVTAYLHSIPLWVFVVILSRDSIIVIGWAVIYFITGSTEIKPRLLGKMSTVFQMVTIWLILLGLHGAIIDKLLIATVCVTALSGIDYLVTGSRKA
ncbi:MAG: CDP-alcohol phosphatidyltransferase family protein [Elusimicrobia bacterium]|nr:CDP-alcohol phosphatidyltransferase family protein [Elusimicrobiota bacterium]